MQEDAAIQRVIEQNGDVTGHATTDVAALQSRLHGFISDHMVADADADCACASLRRASRCVTQLYDLVLAPCGLKCTQFVSLRAIDEAGEIAQYQFAKQYAVAVETLSRRLGALRRKGLVKVRTGTRHGEQIYSLTDEGKRSLDRARPYWERAQERLKTALGDADWNLLFAVTDRVANAALEAERLRLRNSDHTKTAV
jgi:DNA-binding MarR family transcriptional regulator